MVINFLKIIYRDFSRHKLFSWIKIIGFASGIAACFLITLYIRHEVSFDKYYKNTDQIFRVVRVTNTNNNISETLLHQGPFSKTLMEEFPEIKKAGRLNTLELFGAGDNLIRRSNQLQNVSEGGFVYADQELIELLELDFIYGDSEKALNEENTIVITKSKAEQYFPNENPLGKTMIINNEDKNPYKISGVVDDFPKNSHIQCNFLIALHPNIFFNGDNSRWEHYIHYTYILVSPNTNISELEKKLELINQKYVIPRYQQIGEQRDVDLVSASYKLQPIKDIYLKSSHIEGNQSQGNIRIVWLLGLIALSILIIACINFVNLSTAKYTLRTKEIGLRKTIGSRRKEIVFQFLAESIFYSLIATILGIILVIFILPYFNHLCGKSLSIPWSDWWFIPTIILSIIIIGILAGLFPSLYLSSFNPIQALQNQAKLPKGKLGLRGGLVVFQFSVSSILIIGTIIIYNQMEFVLNKDNGYDKEQVLLLHETNNLGSKLNSFVNEIEKLPNIKSVTVSDYIPISGFKRDSNPFWKVGETQTQKSTICQRWKVDENYIKTLGMKVVDGRDFSKKSLSDKNAAIINQTMAKRLNLKNPIGEKITIRDILTWEIIGVVEDFHFESFTQNIEPLCLILGESPQTISVKINSDNLSEVINGISDTWDNFSINQAIRYSFLDENYAEMYGHIKQTGKIVSWFTLLAIVIAGIGLYALSAFLIEQQCKQISIHVIMGASISKVFSLLSMSFIRLVFISIIIAIPVSYFFMKKWLDSYVYKIELNWWMYALAGVLTLGIALLIVSWHSWRAATRNPIEALKYE